MTNGIVARIHPLVPIDAESGKLSIFTSIFPTGRPLCCCFWLKLHCARSLAIALFDIVIRIPLCDFSFVWFCHATTLTFYVECKWEPQFPTLWNHSLSSVFGFFSGSLNTHELPLCGGRALSCHCRTWCCGGFLIHSILSRAVSRLSAEKLFTDIQAMSNC